MTWQTLGTVTVPCCIFWVIICSEYLYFFQSSVTLISNSLSLVTIYVVSGRDLSCVFCQSSKVHTMPLDLLSEAFLGQTVMLLLFCLFPKRPVNWTFLPLVLCKLLQLFFSCSFWLNNETMENNW